MGVFYKGEEIGFIVDSPAKGTLEITENGEYDVSTKAKVIVNVNSTQIPNVIKFSITDVFTGQVTEYQADENMSWGTWIYSSYNPTGFKIHDDAVYGSNGFVVIGNTVLHPSPIKPTDLIEERTDYYITDGETGMGDNSDNGGPGDIPEIDEW